MIDKQREENLEKIRELGQKVRLGDNLVETLDIDFVGADGTEYKGVVEVKRPNMRDYVQMGTLKGKYLQKFLGNEYVHPDYIDNTIKYLAHMLSTMEVVVLRCPVWFLHPEELHDFSVLDHVYTRYQTWLDSFRTDSAGESSGDSPTA